MTDVPVVDRITNRAADELEEAYWEMYQAHEDAVSALEEAAPALRRAGWKTEGPDALGERLSVTVDRLDHALLLNGYAV